LRLRNIVILAVILAVLVGVFYLVSRPEPGTSPKPTVYVWSIDMDDITHITISLPREGLSQSFIKIPQGDKFPWFFDDPPQYSSVNATRWGGGIPLLLSGPGASRDLGYKTDEQLAEYGLTNPSMKITVTTNKDGIESVIESDVGDKTIDGTNYYVRAPGSNQVALVDYTWYEVLERLVKEPPYATGS
jgi:hypothetical protein